MKKIFLNTVILFLSIILIISLSACSKKNNNNNQVSISSKTNNNSISEEERNNIENVVKDFYDNLYNGNIEEALKSVDFAGMELYAELEGNVTNFKTLYNTFISSNEWKEFEANFSDTLNSVIENLREMLINDDIVNMQLSNFRITEVSEDLFKVIADVTETDNNGENSTENDFIHYVLKLDDKSYKIINAE